MGTVIDKGIPPPDFMQISRRKYRVYPFRQMVPGDSVLVDAKGATAFRVYGWHHEWRTTQRREGEGTFRCWRLG